MATPAGAILDNMPSMKGTLLFVFRRALRYRLNHLETLLEFYGAEHFRRQRFFGYSDRQHALSLLNCHGSPGRRGTFKDFCCFRRWGMSMLHSQAEALHYQEDLHKSSWS